MIPTLEPMLNEFRDEAAITTRVLARVPADKLTWKPHSKSMSLGQLALHIAANPGNVSNIAQQDEFDAAQINFNPPEPRNLEEIHATFEQSIAAGERCLREMTEQQATGNWRLTLNGRQIFVKPRVAVLRQIMLNHWYHHRGQLSVYLRLLDIPVPTIYGPSADENPLA
jgi:uncharacterized damage-inducible protein DinB